jgi:D-3-phosphoglycerate dehydrogenase
MKILISATPFAEFDRFPLDRLEKAGFEPILSPYGCYATPEQSIRLLDGVCGIVAGIEPLNREVLTSSKSLKVISRVGIGLDSVDSETAKELGIRIFNTPDAPTQAVAELTVGLMLSLLRQIPRSDATIRHHEWAQYPGRLLFGKKIGLVGLGRIGRQTAKLLQAFEVSLLATDLFPPKEFIQAHKVLFYDSLEEMLPEADIISLHVPYSKSLGPLLGKAQFALMKPGAYLINTSRGSLIDEAPLLHALQNKRIEGAALDVYENEPYKGPLGSLPNVVLTSHVGSYTVESRIRMETEAVENLIKALKV